MDRKGFGQSWQKKEVTFQEDSVRDFVLQEHCFIIQKFIFLTKLLLILM